MVEQAPANSTDPAFLVAVLSLVAAIVGVLYAHIGLPDEKKAVAKTILICVAISIGLLSIAKVYQSASNAEITVADLKGRIKNLEDGRNPNTQELSSSSAVTIPSAQKLVIVRDYAPESPDVSRPGNCNNSASQNIRKLIARCGTQRQCPVRMDHLKTMGDITEDEYYQTMHTMPSAAIFFSTGSHKDVLNDLTTFKEFLRSGRDNSVFILIGRASKGGGKNDNLDLGRKRVLFARQQMDNVARGRMSVMATFGESTLYLTDQIARMYGIDQDAYRENLSILNQSVFAFRFDCMEAP